MRIWLIVINKLNFTFFAYWPSRLLSRFYSFLAYPIKHPNFTHDKSSKMEFQIQINELKTTATVNYFFVIVSEVYNLVIKYVVTMKREYVTMGTTTIEILLYHFIIWHPLSVGLTKTSKAFHVYMKTFSGSKRIAFWQSNCKTTSPKELVE